MMPVGRASAPWYSVPDESITSIEHPCVVKNIDKGITSLGGRYQLDSFLQREETDRGPSKSIGVSLRPDDVLAKPIPSNSVKTKNVLLKVTVPKRTGRKRKRGSGDLFLPHIDIAAGQDRPEYVKAEVVLRSIRDNSSRLAIQPVATIQDTHKFRNLPDFQYSSIGDDLMEQVQRNLVRHDYTRLYDFKPNTDVHPAVANGGPPPQWSQHPVPFPYAYAQLGNIAYGLDENGHLTSTNLTSIPKTYILTISMEHKVVPTGPPSTLEPEESVRKPLRDFIRDLRAAMETRPIMTKRVVRNYGKPTKDDIIRQSLAYVGYTFSSGPWRDTVIRFGVDPRLDPKYRFYQALAFQITEKDQDIQAEAPGSTHGKGPSHTKGDSNRNSHIFDGYSFTPDGKTWQVCDISDPLIKEALETSHIRKYCDANDGWYHNGTWAKVRVVMKDKIALLASGNTPDAALYRRLLQDIPDEITEENIDETVLNPNQNKRASTRESLLATEIRNQAVQASRTRDRLARLGVPGAQKEPTLATEPASADLPRGASSPSSRRDNPVVGIHEPCNDAGDWNAHWSADSDNEQDAEVVPL